MKLTYFSFPKELWRTIRTSKGGIYVVCQYGTGKCKGGGKGKDPRPAARHRRCAWARSSHDAG